MSNFYPSMFTVDTIEYNCNEQYIMASKALIFNDIETFQKIMCETVPFNIKKLGRQVKNFNDDIWLKYRDKVLYDGLYAKFSQNDDLYKLLDSTDNRVLVEASPYDKIYGVGLGENDPKILKQSNWLGENLLGYTLMKVRKDLKDDSK
jgi:ribA/ribD-fused uncharacterized protein